MMPGCFSSSRSRLGPDLGLVRLLVSLSSYFVPPRIFEPVELLKVSVNGAALHGRAPQRGAWVGRAVQPERRIRPWIAQPAVNPSCAAGIGRWRGWRREISRGSGRLLGLQPFRAESQVPAPEGVLPLLIEHPGPYL